jgi:hypothetical protein
MGGRQAYLEKGSIGIRDGVEIDTDIAGGCLVWAEAETGVYGMGLMVVPPRGMLAEIHRKNRNTDLGTWRLLIGEVI